MDRDAIHASNIYYLLEREIVPLFYAHSEGGLSSDWVKRMKTSMINLTPGFDARRMVNEYHSQLYEPAHNAFTALRDARYEPAREKATWNARVRQVWDQVRIIESGQSPLG